MAGIKVVKEGVVYSNLSISGLIRLFMSNKSYKTPLNVVEFPTKDTK
jgi:hypothetical protein